MLCSVSETQAPQPPVNWKRRIIIGAVAVVLLVLLFFFLRAFLPRWWAQRIRSQVGGSFAGGVWWGLFYGVIFTFVPLLIAWQAIRRRWSVPLRITVVVVALLFAAPNLMTLGIVLGAGNAAHAGQRILDVDAPAFRGASLIGAICGAAFAGFLIFVFWSRERRKIQIEELQSEARRRDAQSS
jgi:hypothetical protein